MVSSRSGWDWGLMKGTQHSTPMLGGKKTTVSCFLGIFQTFSHEIVIKNGISLENMALYGTVPPF